MTNIKQNPSSSGLRYNQGKPRHDLVSWPAINELAKVLTAGAQKYADRNWEKGLSYSDTFASLHRHLAAWYNGEENDQETGLPHMAHVLCNAMFLQHFALTNTGTDDRPKYNKNNNSVKESNGERSNETIGTRTEQGYSGFLGDHYPHPLEHGGLLDLQAHVQPRAVQRGSIERADGRVEGYGCPDSDSLGRTTKCWTDCCREAQAGLIPIRIEGNSGGTISLANGDGYGWPAGLTQSSELRLYDNLGTGKTLYMGDGRVDVREWSGGESST